MSAIVLFDGVCNFCDGSVKFIIARDAAGYFKFAPLQSEVGAKLLDEYSIDRNVTDSIVLIEEGRAFTHSTAALKIARRLDGIWKLGAAFVIVPRFIRDFGYRLFAKNRYRLFGEKDECMMPTPEVRARFLASN